MTTIRRGKVTTKNFILVAFPLVVFRATATVVEFVKDSLYMALAKGLAVLFVTPEKSILLAFWMMIDRFVSTEVIAWLALEAEFRLGL